MAVQFIIFACGKPKKRKGMIMCNTHVGKFRENFKFKFSLGNYIAVVA